MTDIKIGIDAYNKADFELAFKTLMPLAKAGHIQAQKTIACMYDFGEGIQPNKMEAIKWYELAACQGDPVSQNNLAGLLLEKQPCKAIHLYTLAAEQNFPFSQEILGDIYSGDMVISGIPEAEYRDDVKAVQWYSKAAQQGFPLAAHRLGEMYAIGQGVAQDFEQSVYWYRKAAECDYQPSEEALGFAYQNGALNLSRNDELARYWLNKSKRHG